MQVEKCFKPSLINRLSEIAIFEPLSRNELREIANIQIKRIVAMMANKGFSLCVTDAALEVILSESHDTVSIPSSISFLFTRSIASYHNHHKIKI